NGIVDAPGARTFVEHEAATVHRLSRQTRVSPMLRLEDVALRARLPSKHLHRRLAAEGEQLVRDDRIHLLIVDADGVVRDGGTKAIAPFRRGGIDEGAGVHDERSTG